MYISKAIHYKYIICIIEHPFVCMYAHQFKYLRKPIYVYMCECAPINLTQRNARTPTP